MTGENTPWGERFSQAAADLKTTLVQLRAAESAIIDAEDDLAESMKAVAVAEQAVTATKDAEVPLRAPVVSQLSTLSGLIDELKTKLEA